VPELRPLEIAAQIDRLIEAQWTVNQPPAPLCSDSDFIRRICLDITGRIPPVDTVMKFLDGGRTPDRIRAVDDLLASPSYGEHFGELWSDRIVPRDLPLDPRPLTQWFAGCFNEGWGWDEVVYSLVSADGSFHPIRLRAPGSSQSPPGLFILVNSEDNLPRPDRLAGASAALFLGAQIQCAECHDHPFARWKQTDFWAMAAFFGRLSVERDQPPTMRWVEAPVAADESAEIMIPSTALKSVGTTVPARLLDDAAYRASGQPVVLRQALARWMTSPENPYLAKAAVNWYWAQFFGRGLVNPVDDLHDENPPSHPAVLQLLADEFARSGCDLKHLIRCLCLSRAYQRDSRWGEASHGSNDDSYACMSVRVPNPGALYDSLVAATGFRELRMGLPRSKSKLGVTMPLTPRAAFIDFFGTQRDASAATDYAYGIPQALKLLNAEVFQQVAPVAQQLARSGLSRDQAVERLYLGTLARRPTPAEFSLVAEFLDRRGDAGVEGGYNALVWVLVNGGEFAVNH
jgi:hypothetical protein